MEIQLIGRLECLDKFIYKCKDDVYVFSKGSKLNCVICDKGIRIEFKRNCYSHLYRPSHIAEKFKLDLK